MSSGTRAVRLDSPDIARHMAPPESLEAAFPAVDCGIKPFGYRVIIQLRTPTSITRGGLAIPEEARETDKWNTQIGRLIAVGPLAFSDRKTGNPWPEGAWAKIGDYVRIGKYTGDRWEIPIPGSKSKDCALFVNVPDLELWGLVTGNPLDHRAYLWT